MTDKIIMYDDPNIVEYRDNIEGWVSNDIFYGISEDAARYAACTHKVCGQCGKIMEKCYTVCSSCREDNRVKRYYKMEYKEYNGEPLYSDYIEEYFIDLDTLYDYCYDNKLNVKDMQLIICEYNYCTEISPYDYYEDIMPYDDDDDTLPTEIIDAFDELNRHISECKEYISFIPGKYRTNV